MTDLTQRIAIVTGGGQGIGRAIAVKLASLGAAVVIADIGEPSRYHQVVKEIEQKGGQATAITANVASAEDVNRLVEQTVSTYGKIDILVNNAGITADGLLMRMPEADWDRVLEVNLKGAFLCTKAVLRYMIKARWGRIINMASVVGVMGNAGQGNYAASKAGIIALTKSTGKEVGSRGITVNAIAPGFIDTPMTQVLSEDIKKGIIPQIPLGRFGRPEDVAQVVAFFASEEAAYITGQVLHVDGGMVMA
ncbi:MAG: 3-oxoacyl-[acyl-carrier-protein] reductase [Dehalococcoidia bacterium]